MKNLIFFGIIVFIFYGFVHDFFGNSDLIATVATSLLLLVVYFRQKSLKEKQYWIATPDHINYFNFESLEKILNKNGFDLIKKESTFPLELFLLMGNNYLNNPNIGKEKHDERMNLEINLSQTGNNDMKKKMYQSFAEIGIGRTAIVYAKKTS